MRAIHRQTHSWTKSKANFITLYQQYKPVHQILSNRFLRSTGEKNQYLQSSGNGWTGVYREIPVSKRSEPFESVFDKVSDQSNVIQRLQRYQNFITRCHNEHIASNTSLTIELILVDPDYRKQGIGNLLMDDLIEFCKLNSIPTIYMFTTSPNFTKLNFKTLESTDELLLLSNCST